MTLKVLVIDDDEDLLEISSSALTHAGMKVSTELSGHAITERLRRDSFDVVVCDFHLPGKSGLQVLKEVRDNLESVPPWIFVTGNVDPAVYEKLFQGGAADVLLKPVSDKNLIEAVRKVMKHKDDPVVEIISIVQAISGIKLSGEKRLLVTNRLQRRARQLNLENFDEYATYLRKNREQEVKHLVSLLSTHTTSFFRESAHFDYLIEKIMPQYAKMNRPMRIWSGASSTGPEIYSLAISIAEFFRKQGYSGPMKNKLSILGTDIDFASVETANQGVYDADTCKTISPELLQRYFRVGKGSLEGYFRINDDLHEVCEFKALNLIGDSYSVGKFDLILLRNILIYFDDQVITKIMVNLEKHLDPSGYLFLGHSESIGHLKTAFQAVGNSVYRYKDAAKKASIQTRATSPTTQGRTAAKLRVIIVDDSAPIRVMLRKIFTEAEGFQVVAEAEDPLKAKELLKTISADVMTLDIHMPHQTGIQYLESLPANMAHPPVVVITSVNYEEATSGLRAFEMGAFDVIEKPKLDDFLNESERIRNVVRDAAQMKTLRRVSDALAPGSIAPVTTPRISSKGSEAELILFGASTGGVEALAKVLAELPKEVPPILIVQHIPPVFSSTFASRLASICAFPVVEATDGMSVQPGKAYVAPGGKQMALTSRSSGTLTISVNNDPPVNRFKPSVDYLFLSAVEHVKRRKVVAVLMTGMGSDGAKGLKALRDRGVHTIAQDQATSVVWGMPGAAVKLDAAAEVLALRKIAQGIMGHSFRKKSAA
jgi:two-component system chemotaxis response regulator CheB